jgi:hypothetical protein
MLERPMRRVEHAGAMQCLVRVGSPFEVQLVASRAVESMLLIGPDLGLDVEGAQESKRAPRDRGARQVEVQRNLAATAQVHAAGDVKESRELGETIAIRIRRDLGELVAQLVRE